MNDEQMDALIETLESWGERADMPLSAIGSMHKAAKALTETRAELAELRARVAVPDDVAKDALEDLADTVSLALSKAWSLGQTYWSQADSESYKQNKKAAETQQTFNALTDATRAAILAAKEKGQ